MIVQPIYDVFQGTPIVNSTTCILHFRAGVARVGQYYNYATKIQYIERLSLPNEGRLKWAYQFSQSSYKDGCTMIEVDGILVEQELIPRGKGGQR